jgi:cyclic pyranopterin phosphate synthase
LQDLYALGIRRINISLDTLNAKKFHTITGRDQFHNVWDALIAAHGMGFAPIKLNVVALAGINDDEILDFARLTFAYPFHVRFIEFMPMGAAAWTWKQDRSLLTPQIKAHLADLGPLQALPSQIRSGPAACFQLPGAIGQIGFISALSHHFCHSCNRMRLTASGKLRPCLLADNEIDIKTPLRSGASDDELARCFFEAVRLKQADHHLQESPTSAVKSPMSGIGG